MNIPLLVLIAVLFGYIEQYTYRNGFATGGPRLFNWLSIPYHVPLGALWLSTCILAGAWWFFPAFCVVQDWAWFRFHPHDTLDPGDWVNAKLGGFYVFRAWIPYTYLIGVGLSIGLYYFFTTFF